MLSLLSYIFVSILAGSFMILLTMLLTDIYRWLYLPAGPLPLPFVGNQLALSSVKGKPWMMFDEWAKV
jgi:hypothetical protein